MTAQMRVPQLKDEEIARIKAQISKIVEDHFAGGTKALFLSRLGSQLGNDLALLERLSGMKLGQFIRSSFEYDVRRGGERNTVLFLVPPGATEAAKPEPAPRYIPKFWAAFAIPLAENEERYIDLATFQFGSDAAALKTAQSDIRSIAAEFTAPRDASGSALDTANRIEKWLTANGLDRERFLATRKSPTHEGKNLLDALIQALDGNDLKRVTLPLDIVKILSERKV